jgi:hypothetical protein
VGLALVGGSFAACGNKNGAAYPPRPSNSDGGATTGFAGGIAPSTGAAGAVTASGAGGAGVADAGPANGTVMIAIQSPGGGSLLSGNASVAVAAKVFVPAPGTDVIDPATVRVSLIGMGGSGAVSSAPLVGPTGGDHTLFTGNLSLAGLPTGSYTLTITAQSSAGVPGSASEMVAIDAGPKITVISPLPGHHYKGSLVVEAVIDPGDFAPASMIACTIAGMPVTLQPTGAPNVYRAVVDLTMPVALSDDQVFEISAQDSKKTVTDLRFTFNVDITGPTITGTVPVPGTVVGQVVRIAANVSDPAGLDASSIQVLIGDKTNPQFHIPLTLDATGAFSTLFDSNLLTSCKLTGNSLCIVRPTLSFRAADALGNETTVSYEIAVDNIPPIADLVPPKIRSATIAMGDFRCSREYDPLSRGVFDGDAPKDGCMVPQLFDLRARIEDDGNHATGLKQTPIAGVDPDTTAAYVLADTSQPLVVDTDGDGFCDVINPKLVPTTMPLSGPRQVLKVRMKPVPPAGQPDYRSDPMFPAFLSGVCSDGVGTDPPPEICGIENPTVVISYNSGKEPAIWAAEPVAPDDPAYCFGSQLDTNANNVPESKGTTDGSGWRCLAIATSDKNGNVSTSMPIRVWVDYNYAGASQDQFCAPPPANAGPMPTCTGTYNKVTDVLSATACKARSFAHGPNTQEVCYQNNCD